MDPEVIDQPEVDQEPSLRETIEEAVDAVENEQGGEAGRTAPDKPAAPEAAKTAPGEGEGKPSQPKPDSAKPATAPEAPAAAADKPAAPQELKAPSQWKPHVREKWNSLPREVQEEVIRRENDNLRLIGSVGQKIKFADEVGQHIAPLTERLQANGANTSEFLGDVFSTVKTLAGGNPQEKAEVIANIIQSYRIDLQTLDNVLAGRLNAPPPDPRILEAQYRARMAETELAKRRQMEERQSQEGAVQTLQQFAEDPKNEFFGDVRELMADLIESGRAKSLEDAYNAAIWANSDTRKILLQREAEARVAAKQNRAGAARRASSSVGGAPRHPGLAPAMGNMSLRDTIAAAMDAQDAA